MAVARDCALGTALLGGQAGFRVPGGPWWADFGLPTFLLLTVCLRIVFPQDSPDKLALWRHLRPARRPGAEGSEAGDEQAAADQAENEQAKNEQAENDERAGGDERK